MVVSPEPLHPSSATGSTVPSSSPSSSSTGASSTTSASSSASSAQDPFNSHLIALLSIYELGPYPGATVPVPRYNGTCSWETEEILRSLGSIAKRLWVAEERVRSLSGHGEKSHGGKDLDGDGGAQRAKDSDNENRLGYSPASTITASAPCTPLAVGSMQDAQTPLAPMAPRSPHMPPSFDGLDTLAHDPTNSHENLYYSPGASPDAVNIAAPPLPLPLPTRPHHCSSCGRPILSATQSSALVDPSSAPSADSDPLSFSESSPLSATEELKLLKAQVSDVARVCNAVARGDLSQKITVPVQGVVMVQLKDVINGMVDKLGQVAKVVTRLSEEVMTEGKLGGQAVVPDVEGTWRELLDQI